MPDVQAVSEKVWWAGRVTGACSRRARSASSIALICARIMARDGGHRSRDYVMFVLRRIVLKKSGLKPF